MNPCRKIKYSEQKTVGGFEVTVNCIQEMNYSGEWESAGWDIVFFGKVIGNYCGYPISSDIQKLLDKETNIQ